MRQEKQGLSCSAESEKSRVQRRKQDLVIPARDKPETSECVSECELMRDGGRWAPVGGNTGRPCGSMTD